MKFNIDDFKLPLHFNGCIFSLIEQYFVNYKHSWFKNLFDENVLVSIDKDTTLDNISHYWNNIEEIESNNQKNDILKINKNIDHFLELTFDFLGWKKIDDNTLKAKYEIVNPYEWIKEHSDEDKRETMYFNNSKITYFDFEYGWIYGGKYNNMNVFGDFGKYDDSIFNDLKNKDISVDPIDTIEQIKWYCSDVKYQYDKEKNIIKVNKTLNEFNSFLVMLFKFYGWYPNEDLKSVYPKYEILDLHKYILDHKKVRICVISSKSFNDFNILEQSLNDIVSKNNYECDKFSFDNEHQKLYEQYKKYITSYEADYHKYGKNAEYVRNEEMIRDNDICVCFGDDEKLNNEVAELCEKYNKTCYKYK